jgi:hypothetical protein
MRTVEVSERVLMLRSRPGAGVSKHAVPGRFSPVELVR